MTDLNRLRFEQVVTDNQSRVFSIALRFLRDRETAEEIAQDVFLQFWQQLHRIGNAAHATWWLRRAICHRCIDEARKRSLRPRIGMESVPEPQAESREADPFLNERLRQLVSDLPDHARMAMILRYQQDLDPADIAEIMKIPVSTVKSQLHRSLAVLRAKLEKQEVYR